VRAAATISFHPSLSGAVPVRWLASVAVARDAGFAAIDVVLPEVADRPAGAVSELLERAGLAPGPASLPVEFRLDEDTFRRDVAELPRLAAFAAAIGVKTMFRSIPASSELPAAELLRTLRRRVSIFAEILREHDIDFAVEVLGPLHRRREAQHEFIWRLPDGADFACSCAADVGVLVDSWHWHHAGGTAQEIVELGETIRHVHVADAPDLPAEAIRDDRRLLPGSGVVDHASFFAALAAAGYARFVSPEVRGYHCGADAVVCARTALDAVLKCGETASGERR
jgi:sugar phosphate isomerase/epimerase